MQYYVIGSKSNRRNTENFEKLVFFSFKVKIVSRAYVITYLFQFRYTEELKAGEKYGIHRALMYSISRGFTYFFCNSLNTVILYVGANMIYSGSLEPAVVVRV